MAKYGDLAIHLGSGMGDKPCDHKHESEPFEVMFLKTLFVRCLDCGQIRATLKE